MTIIPYSFNMTVVKAEKTSVYTIAEIKQIAKQRLPKQVWDYYITGADGERTKEWNEAVFDDIVLRPRCLRDVSHVDTSVTVLGKHYDIPIAVAPSAYQKLCSPNGEIDNYRASRRLGTNYILSSNATTTMEDLVASSPPRDPRYPAPWFQLYFLGSRDSTLDLIRRAEAAGYEALVLTVDSPVLGNRIHDRHEPLALPDHLSIANAKSRSAGGVSRARLLLDARTAAEARDVVARHGDHLIDASLEWDETVSWLRSHTKMKIMVKGVMTAEDAAEAVRVGVDGIIVSNHGGRQLDGVPATLEMLPEIVEVVRGRVPVIFDSGITRGTDVFKALALGADLTLVGKSALWGLAYDGEKGVETVLNILERELTRTMQLSGAKSVRDITRDMLGRRKREGFGIAKL